MKKEKLLEIQKRLEKLGIYHPFGCFGQPIYRTSTFCFKTMEECIEAFADHGKGKYVYTRLGNPTMRVTEKILAIWEGGDDAWLFASGMAVVLGSILPFMEKGDRLLCGKVLYGCTDKFFSTWLGKWGIEVDFVDTGDMEEVRRHLKPNTKVVFVETPANPTMDCTDIRLICRTAHEYNSGIVTVFDNTFATPYNQRPLEMGADLVMHSLTKYLSGHGDLIAGAVIGREELMAKVIELAVLMGAITTPDNAALIKRSLETFPSRMKIHNENGIAAVRAMTPFRPGLIKNVFYPGLNQTACEQMDGFSGIVAFEFADDVPETAIKKFFNHLAANSSIKLAVSLGDTESLIQWPAKMTHALIPEKERLAKGITEKLIRLSVGIEPKEYLSECLRNSLAAMTDWL